MAVDEANPVEGDIRVHWKDHRNGTLWRGDVYWNQHVLGLHIMWTARAYDADGNQICELEDERHIHPKSVLFNKFRNQPVQIARWGFTMWVLSLLDALDSKTVAEVWHGQDPLELTWDE